jgi:hypothetical protein
MGLQMTPQEVEAHNALHRFCGLKVGDGAPEPFYTIPKCPYCEVTAIAEESPHSSSLMVMVKNKRTPLRQYFRHPTTECATSPLLFSKRVVICPRNFISIFEHPIGLFTPIFRCVSVRLSLDVVLRLYRWLLVVKASTWQALIRHSISVRWVARKFREKSEYFTPGAPFFSYNLLAHGMNLRHRFVSGSGPFRCRKHLYGPLCILSTIAVNV